MEIFKFVQNQIQSCDEVLEDAPFPSEFHSYYTGKRVAYHTMLEFIKKPLNKVVEDGSALCKSCGAGFTINEDDIIYCPDCR